MIAFIKALDERSSITCVARERFGQVSVEFKTMGDARRWLEQIRSPQSLQVPEKTPPEFVARLQMTFKNVVRTLDDHGDVLIDVVRLPVLYFGDDPVEGTEEVLRFALLWRFESANKAENFAQELRWLLDAI